MPIKEIITFALGIALTVALTGGPMKMKSNLEKAKIQILRDMTRVDNWGTPTPWLYNEKPKRRVRPLFRAEARVPVR